MRPVLIATVLLGGTFVTTATAATFNQTAFCEQVSDLGSNKKIKIPVDVAKLTAIYMDVGLESRLESQMFETMTTGEGDLKPINGWLKDTCGLKLVK